MTMKKKVTMRNRHPETEVLARSEVHDAGARTSSFEIDLLSLGRLLLRRRRWIVGVVGLTCLLAVISMLTTPNLYTSKATILPTGKSGNFSALRAMAGLTGNLGGGSENSSELFPVILKSDLVKDSLLSQRYSFEHESKAHDLSLGEYLGRVDPDKLRRSLAAISNIATDNRNGQVSLSVETRYPAFSQALVAEYLRQLETFNLYSRRSSAREQVRYLARETEQREADLLQIEDSLASFQSQNRNWANTTNPAVLKQLGRLKRDVQARTQTYAYLLQEYEVAKLDAQKDVPIVRVLGGPSLPTQKSGPNRSVTVITATILSLVLTILIIFAVDIGRQALRRSDEQARRGLAGDLTAAFPRVSRVYDRVSERSRAETISVDS